MTALLLTMTMGAGAQNDHLKLHFDFSQVEGKNVTDAASGITAQLKNQATVARMGSYRVLDLADGTGYLDMTASAGQVVRQLENFTVSVYYRVDPSASLSGAGYFLWCFSQSAANTQTSAPYTAYRLNAQRMATSTGGWGNETGMEMGTESDKGRWIHMLYRQTGKKGELYLDGKQVKQLSTMPLLKDAFTATPAYNWIGRPPFSADSYLKQTLVADFRVYDVAVADEVVAQLAAETARLDDAYVNGGGGDNTALLKAIAEAEQLLGQAADYPTGAVQMLRDVVSVARGTSGKDLSQMIFNNMESDLRQAMTVYKSARGVVFDVSGITDVYDTERGFRHPGGLHTDADFERIRRQLAEGNATVTAAYEKLKNAEYARADIQTWPVETIVRGGSSGQNYLNAARGATMAYQNALRWKIDGTEANAKAAVRILMAWANTCKLVSGDSNWALAAGLYGYEFAQAAELMRDYEGWSRDDFELFKHWMLTVWYPGNINFLRGRNGTWENWVGGQGGPRPGHYWSNWPLCNALATISIGILCDDVFIYNQGMSFMKYDQAGTFQNPRTANPILSDGCTEFIGNLVVTTSESPLETGAYGQLGQMQESGRDGGHAAMALGLAVDICKVAWNQGDDLFSYMDNRMAAGIEFVAACTQNVQGLPWTNYKYVDCRTAWHNGWLMEGPAEPAEMRPYWGTVIGHYESVKGVRMPFAEKAYQQMGIDAGGMGSTSGPYDHLGYSVLMNTYDTQLCPEDQRPTLLTPRMVVDGRTIDHNELGGLRNTYVVQSTQPLESGKTVTLMPQLPEGEEDTGLWQWNTGETTRNLTVTADHSYVYRVTYTNRNGIKSEQAFTLAVEGDCTPSPVHQSIMVNGETVGSTSATIFYGDKLTLSAGDAAGWWTAVRWDNGATGNEMDYGPVATSRTIQAYVESQGGRRELVSFDIDVRLMETRITVNGETTVGSGSHSQLCKPGDAVSLQVYVPAGVEGVSYLWDNGSTASTLTIPSVETSGIYTVTVTYAGITETVTFGVFLKDDVTATLQPGNYMVRHAATDTYLTANSSQQEVSFQPGDAAAPTDNQVWTVSEANGRHAFTSLADGTSLASTGKTIAVALKVFYLDAAAGVARYALHTGTGTSARYWTVSADGALVITQEATPTDFPFEFIPVSEDTGIKGTESGRRNTEETVYDLQGRPVESSGLKRGIYIVNGRKLMK